MFVLSLSYLVYDADFHVAISSLLVLAEIMFDG